MTFLFQVEPQEIAESSFWVKAEEDKFESPELFAKLAITFGTQVKGMFFFYFLSHAFIKCKAAVVFFLCFVDCYRIIQYLK